MGRSARQAEKRFKRHMPEFQLDSKGRLAHSEPSHHGRVHAPSQVEVRRCIENGACPFCGRKYHDLAQHTNKIHGVDRYELKDMAGLTYSTPVCSPELSATRADGAQRSNAADRIRKIRGSPAGRKLSRAGREAARRNATNQDVAARSRSATTNRERHLAKTKERDAQIIERLRAGWLAKEVAEELGVGPDLIRQVLKRRKVDINLRKARMLRPEIKAKAVAAMATGHRKRPDR